MKRHPLCFLFLIQVTAAGVLPASDKVIDLDFTPAENITAPVPATKQGMFGRKIKLMPIVDRREQPDLAVIGRLGENQAVRAEEPVVEFVAEVTERCLTEWGLSLNDDGDMVLSGELVKFTVDVQTMFAASVNIRFHLARSGGGVLWEGLAVGDARRFGLAASESNYNETLSDALKEALANLLGNEGFQDALIGRVAAAEPANLLLSPDALLTELLSLSKEGFGEGMLLAYVGQRTLEAPLTAAMIIQWKQAGVSENVIKAAMLRVRQP